MQVRLTTTISTIIEVAPENTESFETARAQIFGAYGDALDLDADQEQVIEAIQQLQAGSGCLDTIIATQVTHSFEEVK